MALSAEGRILAIDYDWTGNVGAHPVSYTAMANGSRIITSVYHVPVVAIRVRGVMTNSVSTAPYRGAGRPEAMHVMERLLDLAATKLGLDRAEIRRRNLITRDQLPYRNPMGLTYDSGDFAGNMQRVLELAEWSGFPGRRAAARAKGRLRGIGLANYIEAPVGMPREQIRLRVTPDDIVDVITGTQSTGQGHATSFAQVLVAQLGVPLESIRIRGGDTAFVEVGGGTHSDRSMRIAGALLVQAAADIVEIGRPTAAMVLQCMPERLCYVDGAFIDPGSARSISLFDLARHIAGDGLSTDPSLRNLETLVDFVGRMPAHPTGSAVMELEVDPETGVVELLHYASVDDVGKPINPMIVEGQVHGGLVQGIVQALAETYRLDADGQLLSGSYVDYELPRADRLPRLSIELREDPTYGNPLGVKGGGESGITPTTAVIFNALADALGGFGEEELSMPATTQTIWAHLHRRGSPNEERT